MQPSRSEAARQGEEAVQIIRDRGYTCGARRIDLSAMLARCVEQTVEHPVGAQLPTPTARGLETRFEVMNDTTLRAARSLLDDGERPVALNFASAHKPGGGFRSGARAQEESLARASGLFACLDGREMYRFHESPRDPLYSSWLIYSPEVPIFRADDGALLDEPWACAFITSAAPNAGVALERAPNRKGEVSAALEERIDRVLAAAALHQHRAVVLGAWGCGVFKNSADEVAGLFSRALRGPFSGCFARVVFAVLDTSEERRFIAPFEAAFGSAA
jgi:uncharacterized protein (TIGR02452 family)